MKLQRSSRWLWCFDTISNLAGERAAGWLAASINNHSKLLNACYLFTPPIAARVWLQLESGFRPCDGCGKFVIDQQRSTTCQHCKARIRTGND